MSRSFCAACLFIALALPVVAGADPAEKTSTVDTRDSVNVTVYNGGIALVHDRRRVLLDEGINRVAWRDVAAQIDASSALLDSPGNAGPVTVTEQNFDYDLLDPSALLQRYVGKTVTVVHDPHFAGQPETRETARLLSTNGGIILQYRDRIETELRGHIIFPESPAGFRDRPTLLLDMLSQKSGVHDLDLSYVTGGMSWRADYVGVISSDEKHMDLHGLVTLSNDSGEGFDNARLQLIAGNVNVPPTQTDVQAMKTIARVTARSGAYEPSFQQDNYFEYHLYTLDRPTTIRDKETKQITLMRANGVPIVKTLELRGSPDYYHAPQQDLGDRLPVGVYVTFQNRGGGLGIPLPGGMVRLYKSDAEGLSQFVGADTIDHTPKNEPVRMHLGDSFDVTARKRQTDFRSLGECVSQSTYQITLSNAKPVAQDVLVVEAIPGDWMIDDETARHWKSSASTANWALHVPAGGRTMLSYTAIAKWC